MASILDTVDQRTQLVGENRLELLMFRLHGRQAFAINVFKVQEVQQMPKLTVLPKSYSVVVGVTHVRGNTIPVIDLSRAIGFEPLSVNDKCNIIISEYNTSVQAFMVRSVDRIINLNWNQIQAPPKGTGKDNYLTAITQVGDELVEVIDVEKVLATIRAYTTDISSNIFDPETLETVKGRKVLLVDDSKTAISQVKTTLEKLGIQMTVATNGVEALRLLKNMAAEGKSPAQEFMMMITDAEMPEMDGYRLTHECRHDPLLKDLYIVMHTSLSGNFNGAMAKKVGCDGLISKFQPDELARFIQARLVREKTSS